MFVPGKKKFLFALSLGLVGIPAFTLIARAALQDSPKAVLDEAWQIVNQEYVDPKFNQVDWQQVRQSLLDRSYTSPEEAYTALRDALKKLDDPYTRFMTPDEFQAFKQNTSGQLVGIGLKLGSDPQTHAVKVVQPIQNSPASQAGIQAGDEILEVDGKSVQGMEVGDVVNLIRGEAQTSVKLTLKRQSGTSYEVSLIRQKIQIPTVNYGLRVEQQQRIGYIRLNEFNAHAAEEMEQAITDLKQQQVNGFVLDLRDNPGGMLDQGIAIAQMWIDQGDIVQTVDRQGKAERFRANHTALTDLPLAVLVNGNSASASEILTGALKDDDRAVVVGTQTFGKALVQSVNPLADGSGLNVTIAHYFTPAGLDINHRGITPDRVVPLTKDQEQYLATHQDQVGTAQDPQFVQGILALESRDQ